MLLECKVWSSREWYEEVEPLLRQAGFSPRADLRWADPESDGEYMGVYFDYVAERAMSAADFSALMAQVEQIVRRSEAPSLQVSIVRTQNPA